jgi:26S proteasome non-ATPase regulatory subunit 9
VQKCLHIEAGQALPLDSPLYYSTPNMASTAQQSSATGELKQILDELQKQRKSLEEEISLLSAQSTSSPSIALVDSEGFPRADLDVHNIRIDRNRLATLQNDHKRIMKQIEANLFKLHQLLKQNKPATATPGPAAASNITNKTNINGNNTTQPTTLQPEIKSEASTSAANPPAAAVDQSNPPLNYSAASAFYLVDNVNQDSPAQISGLRIGDKVVQFGSMNKTNFSPSAVAEIVRNSLNKEVLVVIYRNGEGIKHIKLIPQTWSGQGLLGCHLQNI